MSVRACVYACVCVCVCVKDSQDSKDYLLADFFCKQCSARNFDHSANAERNLASILLENLMSMDLLIGD